eukprot:CAMPEP_0181307688 /NCGR_PEP_ID=MMETSP1101-20121128/11027_1 /TAXON_ID=46948 /ORGANISM="Rhodomonas abbreviata, Strain Caron Lab Isolate" /LENGTH=72 /DNA_ID=CAMNT_0023413949 /DNA_START=65 /DNA_END=279 /DNA_ORIENTATION=+
MIPKSSSDPLLPSHLSSRTSSSSSALRLRVAYLSSLAAVLLLSSSLLLRSDSQSPISLSGPPIPLSPSLSPS